MIKVSRTPLNALFLGVFALGLGATATLAQEGDDKKRKRVTEVRKVAAFTQIDLLGSPDIVVKIGKIQSIEVKADNRLIDTLETVVEGNTLVIKYKNRKRGEGKCLSFCSYYGTTVNITVPRLEGLTSKGSGDVYVEGLKADKFNLVQKGSGDIEVNGTCKKADMAFKGSGDFETSSFKCDDVVLSQRGSGDMDLSGFVVKTLTLGSSGSGDWDLSGSCDTMEIEHRASGDFDARDFKCRTVDVETNGSGDVDVFASKEINVNSRGSGDVDIYGGGKLGRLKTRGSGDVETH